MTGTTPNDMQNKAYDAIGKGSRAGFSHITGGFTQALQAALSGYLEKEHIDINSLSAQEKYEVLNKFLETHYEGDSSLLSDEVKWENIEKEQYFLDEILQDTSLSAYTEKTQGNTPFAQGLITTILTNVLKVTALPEGFKTDINKLIQEHKKSPLTSIDILRTRLGGIINHYDPEKNTTDLPEQHLIPEQKKQLADISISNKDILETLRTENLIDAEQYDAIKNKNYADRSPERKKIWATQLRKQFTYSYLDSINKTKGVGEGMEGLVKLPSMETVFGAYAKKLNIPYDQLIDQSKPAIMFSARSAQEKQALMDTMVEEYYIPNAKKFAAQLGMESGQYESFVRQLFSLDTKELTIPGPEGNEIKLKFLKKELNATIPVEGMEASRLDLPIPFDFVIDGSDNQTVQKLAMTMPGKQRHTINGMNHIDPQQELTLQVNGQVVSGYGYKVMHDGKEQYVITQKYNPQGPTDQNMRVLCKDGAYKILKTTQADEVIMMSANKNAENDGYQLGQKEPLVYSMQPDDVSGLLTAYCLNNSTNLSEEDRAKLFIPVPIAPKLDEFFKDGMLGKDSENKERLDSQEQQETESPEDFETRVAKERQDARSTWNKMPGVKDTKMQKGTQLAIQNVNSIFEDVAGNGGYTMLEIVDADNWENPTRFKYKVLGGVETDISDESGANLTGQVSERLPFTKEFLDKLRDYGNGSLYKFPPKEDIGGIIDYAKTLDFDNPGMNEIGPKFAKLHLDGNSLKRDKDEIKYFGMGITKYDEKGTGTDGYVMFSVDFGDDTVTVSDKIGGYEKIMTYSEFLLFASDKGLNAYTQKDHDALIHPHDGNHGKGTTAVFMMSPMNIIDGVKKWRQGTIVDGAKKSNDRRADKIEEMFYTSGVTNYLGNMPFRGEYFVQAQDSYDGKLADKNHKIIMEGDATMNQRGKKLVWGKQTFIDNHNLKGRRRQGCLDYIEEKFKKAQNGTLTDVDRREAFAGLLYVLEKFQITYPRTLAKYAGQNLWPKLLLNEEKYNKYMEGFNDAKAKLEAGVLEGENVRELTENVMEYDVKNMSELMKDEYHRFLYGYKSIPVLQEHSGKRATDVARKDGAEAAGHHPAFMRAYKEEIELKIRYGQYSYAIGALIQLSKRKEISVPQYYRLWMGALLKIMLSGGMKYVANRTDKKLLRDMLRKHGIPIANFILDNSRGAEDLAIMLDLISRKTNPNGKSFKDGTGWNTSLTAYETRSKPKDFNDKKDFGAHETFNKNFDRWFMGEGNAARILPFLENSNLNSSINMATLAQDPSLNPEEKSVVGRYLNYSLNANNTRDFDMYRGADDFVQNLIQDRTIFNTSRRLVQEQYMNYQKGGFGKEEEMTGYFRNALRDQARKYAATDPSLMPRASVELIMQKFYSLFQNQYGGDHQWFAIMLAYIKKEPDPKKRLRYARAGISRYIENYNFNPIPPMVREALQSFDSFFANHIDKMDDDMVSNIFNFRDLDGIPAEKHKAIELYQDITHRPEIASKYDPQIRDYVEDLFAGKIQRQKHFEGIQEGYKSTRIRKEDEEGLAMEAEQSDMNQQATANAERSAAEATRSAEEAKAAEEKAAADAKAAAEEKAAADAKAAEEAKNNEENQ